MSYSCSDFYSDVLNDLQQRGLITLPEGDDDGEEISRDADAVLAAVARLCEERAKAREALAAAAELVKTARQHFPESVKNADRFQLENTNAAIGRALAVYEAGNAEEQAALDAITPDEITLTRDRTWVNVGPFAVLLNRTDEGLIVDIWPKGAEDGDSLDTVAVLDSYCTKDEPEEGACTNPGGHEWNRSAAEADEAWLSGDHANDNIRCIHCGADGDA